MIPGELETGTLLCISEGMAGTLGSLQLPGHLQWSGNPSLPGLLKASRPSTDGHSRPPESPRCRFHPLHPLLFPLGVPHLHCHHSLDSGPKFGRQPATQCTSSCCPSAGSHRRSALPALPPLPHPKMQRSTSSLSLTRY